MKNRLITGTGAIVAGLLIIFGPQTIFKICGAKPDGTWMKCHWSAQAEIGAGLFLAALGILLLLFSSKETRLGLSLAAALAGIPVVLLPTVLIGGCSVKTMNCQRITFPVFLVIGSLVFIAFVFNAIFLFLSIHNRKE